MGAHLNICEVIVNFNLICNKSLAVSQMKIRKFYRPWSDSLTLKITMALNVIKGQKSAKP